MHENFRQQLHAFRDKIRKRCEHRTISKRTIGNSHPIRYNIFNFLNNIGENTAKRTGIDQNRVSKQLKMTYKEAFSFY